MAQLVKQKPRTHEFPTAKERLLREYINLKKDLSPYVWAEPWPHNMYVCNYVLKGSEGTPYFGGYYHGTLEFPMSYPMKPPEIRMITPNGRFFTNVHLCTGMSDSEAWVAAWTIPSILISLLSFMNEDDPNEGSCKSTLLEKMQFARESLQFNIRNKTFCKLFPQIVDEIKQRLAA